MSTCLITGINKGIGLALAKQLAQDPKNIVIGTVRDLPKAQPVYDLNLPNIKVVYTDMRNGLEQMKQDFKDLPSLAPKGIDVFIHNAAIGCPGGFETIYKHDWTKFVSLYETNVGGAIKVYKVLYPHLLENKSKLVFISSIVGTNGDPFYGINSYGTSKAALNHVVKQIATETKFTTIAMHPGVVATDMTAGLISSLICITPEQSAAGIVQVTNKLSKKDNAKFYSYDGTLNGW